MSQPSVQGIASLFRGNPAPLQQRIQQEQQGKPGLPPDLRKLLALNIVTNEEDAMAKQQAMNQLAQMQGPQGKPPTVMETVQEQARQKMQAQAMQAQRQQQGLQALMQQAGPGPVPEGTQFAEAQPSAQGIDELPVEFEMAGGGIVAFDKGGEAKYETPYDRMNRRNRGELTEEERKEQEEREARIAQIPTGGEQTVAEGERVRRSDLERNILNTLAALPGAGVTKATTLGRQSLAGLASLLGMDKSNAPERMPERVAPPAASRPTEVPYSNEGRTGPRPYTPAPKPVADLRALAEQQVRQQAPRPAPVEQAAAPAVNAPQVPPALAALNAPVPESDADRIRKLALMRDPEAARLAEQERRRREVGELNTTQYDRMIEELEKRKAQLEGPKDQWGQLMEYLGQIAATPRGLSSFEAGAAGAAGVRGLEAARNLEQFNLSKQAVEVSQKKLDAVRAFAEKQYDVGKSTFDQVYKIQYDAAKEISGSEADARKLAQQQTLKLLELDQEMKRKEMDIEQRKAEEKGRMARDRAPLEHQVFAGYLKAAGNDIPKAYEMMKAAGVSSAAKPMTRDQASDNVAKKLEISNPNRKITIADATQALRAAGIANPTLAQIEEHLIQEQMRGVSLSPPASSGVIDKSNPLLK